MSKHTIILTEDQIKAILEKRKKVVRNDEGDIVPEQCDECGAEVRVYIQGEPVYLCSKCHKYFGTMPFNLHEGKTYVSNILNEGYWGHLPLENDSALDEFGDVAYNNIGEQLKNIDKNWDDKLSVFTYLSVIMYMLQIYNSFYSLKSLDKKFDFTNKINKAIKYIDDEEFINTWDDHEEVKEYIKKLPDTFKNILDKNSIGSDNFEKLKVSVPCNEGKNYVNMNVELRKGGRNAVKMSVEDFKQEMIHAYHMYAMEQGEKYKSSLQLTPSPGNFVYSLCYGSKINKKSKYASALYDDIWCGKYKFDSENVDARGGIKMSKKGFPYIQCAAGGDWECPVCFFVYFDGNKFRGYVPLKGNALNRNEKHAFSGGGNEPDAKFVQKELGIDYEEADHMCGDIDYNVDACMEDFLSRVEVKGTYKKRDHTKDEETFKEYRKEKIADEKKKSEEAERRRQMNAQAKLGEPSEGKDLAVPITEAVTGEDDKKAAAIYAYCESEDGNDYCILCAKRLEGDEKGKYNPPMGHLHVGESPKDGAVRECEEESGVKIPKDKLRLGSTEKWGTNYYVYLEGTPKDWPIGEGDEENEQFMWIPMKDLFFGDKKDWEWAWSTKEFANRFAPAELDLSERRERKNVILSEEQVHSIQRKIFTESFSPKRQVVLLIKDYLDKSFAKTFVDDINDNGYPVKVPMVSMLSANGQTLKQMQIQDLLILLDDKFRNLIKKDDDRKALLKQIIIDWFNGNISKEGLLSKNSL